MSNPSFSKKDMTLTYDIEIDDPDGTFQVVVHAKLEICPLCSGRGSHSHAIGAITSTEWNEDWDPEEQERYLRGDYDRSCECCGGSGKIPVPDRDRIADNVLGVIDEFERHEAEYQQMCRMERLMGA